LEDNTKDKKEDKIIVEKIVGRYHIGDLAGQTLDPVVMTHDQLLKPHQKVISVGGHTLGISLEGQERLFNGAILWQDETMIIAVILKEEDVLEVRPFSNEEWAKVAFNIGNLHHSAYLYPTFIRIPYDPIVEQMLRNIGAPMERKMARLDGERANAAASHGHSHDDDLDDNHNHHQDKDYSYEG
jgi:urease accessory protein